MNKPKQVNIISVNEIDVLYGGEPESALSLIRRASLLFIRYFGTGLTRISEKQFDRRRLNRWNSFYSKVIPRLEKCYDCAVSYSGGETFWYLAEKVDAATMFVYFHSDYSNIDVDIEGELFFLERANGIVTISDKCADSLKILFSSVADRVRVIQNPSSRDMLENLSRERVDDGFRHEDCLKIISIGRLHPIKGFDMAVEAAALLQRRHPDKFEWIVVGDGEQRKLIEDEIEKHHLSSAFGLVGSKSNPYPYLVAADVLAQPSRLEGKSVVLDEAKLLGKPILATAYPSAADQVEDGTNGLIVPISANGIADGLSKLLVDRALLDEMTYRAQEFDGSALGDVSEFTGMVMGVASLADER